MNIYHAVRTQSHTVALPCVPELNITAERLADTQVEQQALILPASECSDISPVNHEAAALVASLRSKSSVPHSIIPEIIGACQRMLDHQAVLFHDKVAQCCHNSVSVDTTPPSHDKVVKEIQHTLRSCTEASAGQLNFLSITYKQDKFF